MEPITPSEEVLNYRTISLFYRQALLNLKNEHIVNLIFKFLQDHFNSSEMSFYFLSKIKNHDWGHYKKTDLFEAGLQLLACIQKQVETEEEISYYQAESKVYATLLLKNSLGPIAVICLADSIALKNSIQSAVSLNLLHLFMKTAATLLYGAMESEKSFKHEILKNHGREGDRLVLLNQKLEQANQSKAEFLARMSHEMRTPLNVILGLIETLAESKLEKTEAHLIDVIQKAGVNLLLLINDVLDLSKIEANEMKLDLIPIDFYDLIEQVITLFQEKATKNNILLSFSINEKIPKFVLGDALRLRQVLLNLLGNSLKFTPSGEISLTITPFHKPGHILFEISDTGIGLNDEQKSKIFEPFIQSDETIAQKYGGTGLGLSISKKIVNLMGGNILVKDNERANKGLTFLFDCRLQECQRPLEKNDSTIISADFLKRKIKILAVDDSAENQLVIKMYCKNTGFDLTMAENGQEALDKFNANKYDLILMDKQMPMMNGIESSKKIREIEAQGNMPRTPIIALTADAFSLHSEELLHAGCDDVLTKPVKKNELLSCIFRWAKAPKR